jgi:hypothetical protein
MAVKELIAVEASAEVRQVKTAVDNSITVTLNFPEPYKQHAKKFIDWVGLMVRVVAVLEDSR